MTAPFAPATDTPRLSADDITTLVAAITENAHRLGLKWLLRPGTVANGDDTSNVSVKVDGDDVPTVGVVSTVGELPAKARVWLLIIPTVGTYVIGVVGNQHLAHSTHFQTTLSTTASTTYANLTNIAGVAFIAPPSGIVTIIYTALVFNNDVTGGAGLTPWIGRGPTVGSGTEVMAASDQRALSWTQHATASEGARFAAHHTMDPNVLVPGAQYNVSMRGRAVTAGTASFQRITTTVIPSP